MCLRGAFGQVVCTQLTEAPLGVKAGDGCGQLVLTPYALADGLVNGVNVLERFWNCAKSKSMPGYGG